MSIVSEFLSDRVQRVCSEGKVHYYSFFIYLKDCGTALNEAPPAAARKTLLIVATKLASTAQCGTFPVSPITGPPKMSKSWLIRGAAQYLEKIKKTVG